MTRSSVHELIEAVARGERVLHNDELQQVLEHVARAGFDPQALERVRGRLTGTNWQGSVLKGSDRLPPATVHFLWHVITRREWPDGTTIQNYIDSLREVVRDPSSGVVVVQYQGALQLGVIRESGVLRGPMGHDWVLIRYRVSLGYWVTAFQPERGPHIFNEPQWTDVQWLRQPTSSNAAQSGSTPPS